MSERDDDPAGSAGAPLTTGEFRIAPDASASTAQFRAFAQRPAGDGEARSHAVRRVAGITTLVLVVVIVLAILAIVH